MTFLNLRKEKPICLNEQTAENLISYLKQFPKNAKVVIWYDYNISDCTICCNTEHQKETNTIMLAPGRFIKKG